MSDILSELASVLDDRKNADPASSYVANLYESGMDVILKKIGEEATEVIIAGKSGDQKAVIYETADLWFHSLILLSKLGLGPNDVLLELQRRFGQSGIMEKNSRKK